MNKTPTTLIIMDGFGLSDQGSGNAVRAAKTPRLDKIFASSANTTLQASGLEVGLPEGQMGNSEVGHTNIGAGRVVFQDLPRISNAVADGSFFQNPAFNHAMTVEFPPALEITRTDAPDSAAAIALHRPAPPLPKISTSV